MGDVHERKSREHSDVDSDIADESVDESTPAVMRDYDPEESNTLTNAEVQDYAERVRIPSVCVHVRGELLMDGGMADGALQAGGGTGSAGRTIRLFRTTSSQASAAASSDIQRVRAL